MADSDSVPTEEQIEKWRTRWKKYPGLVDEIIKILVADKPVETGEEAAGRMWQVNALLESTSESDFEIYKREGKRQFIIDEIVSIPALDLKCIHLIGRKLNGVVLSYAHLEGANLDLAQLKKTDLSRAHFEAARMVRTDLEEADLFYAHLEEANLGSANLIGADLYYTHLGGANLWMANFQNANVAFVKYNRKTKFQGIQLDSCYGSPRFIRFAKDQEYLEELRNTRTGNTIYWIWYILADCGRSIWRWAGWSLFFALGFACIFQFALPGEFHIKEPLPESFLTMVYYSVVTFTTLGFGDITPKTTEAAWWVMAEVITGYIMLGGLISILANKLARRS